MSNDSQENRDWEAIEVDVRAGVLSWRAMGKKHGLSHTAIYNKAKREGWERDLSGKIKQQARNKVNKALANKNDDTLTDDEKEVIEAAATAIKDVILSHRKDIDRFRTLATDMLTELEQHSKKETWDKVLKALVKNDMNTLAKLVQKMTSLPVRIKGLAELSSTLKNLITLERQAFSVDANDDDTGYGRQLTDLERSARIAALLERGRERRAG